MAEPLTDERLALMATEYAALRQAEPHAIATGIGLNEVIALIAALQEARREVAATLRKFNCANPEEFWERIGKLRERAESAERTAADKSAECERYRAAGTLLHGFVEQIAEHSGCEETRHYAKGALREYAFAAALSPTPDPDTFTPAPRTGRLIE